MSCLIILFGIKFLTKENSQVVSVTTQLKFPAPDGKKRLADMLDYTGIIALGKEFPGKKANRFIDLRAR